MNKIIVEVSIGELLDKISILEIKQEKIKDPEKLKFINNEHSILKNQLEKNIEYLTNGKKTKIINEWVKNSETINKKVMFDGPDGKISGIAKKIDSDGALIIKTKHGTEKLLAGDITY